MVPRPLAVLALGLCACGGDPEGPSGRVVLVGIDGLEPALASELIEAGRMPNLARFATEGTLGRLATFQPTYSPVIWTTIATGQPMDAHGIDFFHGENGLPYTSNSRRVPALWNLVSDAGRSVDCVGWWVSWPAEEVNGRIVSSYAAQAQFQIIWKGNLWRDLPHQTWPPGLVDALSGRIVYAEDASDLLPRLWEAFPKPDGFDDELDGRLVNDLAWAYAGDATFGSIAEWMLENEPSDLVMAYLSLPDVAGHRFWRYHEPDVFHYEVPARQTQRYGEYVRLAYEETDEALGRLLERAPADATVIVLSDHGMHEDKLAVGDPEAITSGHHQDAPPGVIGALGPNVARRGNLLGDERRGELGDVHGVAPLVLHLLGLPVPEHWRGATESNECLRLLDERWRREHPLRRAPSPDPEFREATPPMEPSFGMGLRALEALEEIGYVEIGVDELRRDGTATESE